jgi:hypothetical protein
LIQAFKTCHRPSHPLQSHDLKAEAAEEVAAHTDPKTLAKIAVTEAIRNATMQDFDGENFVINGKTTHLRQKCQCVSAPILLQQKWH